VTHLINLINRGAGEVLAPGHGFEGLEEELLGVEQKTGIEKIQQHISECNQRIEQKRKMWIQAQNSGDWVNSENLGKVLSEEKAFVSGLERALAHLAEDEIDEQTDKAGNTAYVYVIIDHNEIEVLRGISNGRHYPRPKFPQLAVNRLISCEFIDCQQYSDGDELISITTRGLEYLAELDADSD
jgi:hypothetical protein